MKFSNLPKNLKERSRKTKIYLSFFAVFLVLLILAALPNTSAALSTDNTKLLIADKCGDDSPPAELSIPLNLFPYVITPRHTLLLRQKPKLRWNAVKDAKSYTVSLLKGEKTIWNTTVRANEVLYSGPQLEPSIEYVLFVQTNNNKTSAADQTPAQGFRLLPVVEAQVVKEAIAQLDNQKITANSKALQAAYIYIGSDLKAEAIETLEALVASGTKEAFIYRKLGDLYLQTGVNLLAESKYLEAFKLATAANNIPEQAQISEDLGNFYLTNRNKPKAITWLTQARESHKKLGNTQRVKELDTQIENLKPPSPKPS